MKKRWAKAGLVALMAAIVLALASVHVERIGPRLVQYGNLCGPGAADPCYRPELKGGFPVAFLFDAPGVSRERQLAFGEDRLVVGALVLDIAVYFALALLAALVLSRRRPAKADGTPGVKPSR
ncbi:hypothetical protein [Massilia sp. GCM10023247]|uniref:hypothetical protein n=1 Tax=Massilia sp. GCM10023247 TaxID=3252643 RepID=UPI0036172BA5